jgi:glycerol-1-phosphate dehydrogenase [NAD(P)+]
MSQEVPIYIGPDAVSQLVTFCARLRDARFTLVSDTNTYRALGEQVEAGLRQAGLPLVSIVLAGDEVIADEKYLIQTMVLAPPSDQVFVAIGSGTLTDIARYISFRTRNPFISVPTAASVDGFLSTGAPLVVGGIKETYKAQGPIGVFGDIQTLMDAPSELRAAGFGDVIGKTTSLADWQLGRLLWNEPYDPAIERRVRHAMTTCCEAVDDIASGSEQGIRYLMGGLLETGLCMLEVGNSRPASGAEHHCSHYWEIQLLKEHKPAILHGAKVGYATTLIARLYDAIRNLTQEDVKQLVQNAPFPDHDTAINEIRHAYGAGAEQVLKIQEPFLTMTEAEYRQLQQRIVENWPAIRAIAETVLPASTVSDLLDSVGGPTDWQTLGLQAHMIEPALMYGHYLRNRFTVVKLCKMLGLDVRQMII